MTDEDAKTVSLEFAERLAGPFHAFGGVEAPRGRVFASTQPPGLPLDVPLPPGAILLGSRLSKSPLGLHEAGRGVRREEDRADLYFDSPGDRDAVFAFYDREMPARGWKPPSFDAAPRRERGGFQTTPFPYPPTRRFCAGPRGPTMTVTVWDEGTGTVDVRIHLDLSDIGWCAPPPKDMFEEPRVLGVLPELNVPPGARVSGSSGGGGNDDLWLMQVRAETPLSAAELESHYARQLAKAGWAQRDGGMNGPLAWSTWTSPPPGIWEAMFWVVEEPEPNHRWLHMRIERTGLRQSIERLAPRFPP
jgi:hypothetical protein